MCVSKQLYFWIVLVMSFLSGCRQAEVVEVYEVCKEGVKNNAIEVQKPSSLPMVAEDKNVTYQVPVHWVAQPLDRVRKGLWKAHTAAGDVEISLTAFPGDVGGHLANVNRWLSQIGLPAIDSAGLEKLSTTIVVDNYESRYVVLSDSNALDKAILAVIIPMKECCYFIKAMGPVQSVLEEKANFEVFVKSFSFDHAS